MTTKHRPNHGRYLTFDDDARVDAIDPWSPYDEDYAAHGVTIVLRENDTVEDYGTQDDVHRWEDERGMRSPRIDHRRRGEREAHAARRLGRNPFLRVSDADVARAHRMPPTTTIRRTAPRARGAGRPAGRPATRTAAGGGDDDSGGSGGDDPHLTNAARTLAAILARRSPGVAWTVEVRP